jgi:hypothetical protein
VENWLALALTTIPDNSDNLDRVLTFVQVRKAPAAVGLHVLSMGKIVGYSHGIPKIATSIMARNGRNERWIVNSHIAWATWNDVYN